MICCIWSVLSKLPENVQLTRTTQHFTFFFAFIFLTVRWSRIHMIYCKCVTNWLFSLHQPHRSQCAQCASCCLNDATAAWRTSLLSALDSDFISKSWIWSHLAKTDFLSPLWNCRIFDETLRKHKNGYLYFILLINQSINPYKCFIRVFNCESIQTHFKMGEKHLRHFTFVLFNIFLTLISIYIRKTC